jgi:hypothetical protein
MCRKIGFANRHIYKRAAKAIVRVFAKIFFGAEFRQKKPLGEGQQGVYIK